MAHIEWAMFREELVRLADKRQTTQSKVKANVQDDGGPIKKKKVISKAKPEKTTLETGEADDSDIEEYEHQSEVFKPKVKSSKSELKL